MNSLVVMGVSGCGKSHVAELIARRLQMPLIEGDAFHPEANRQLMQNGVPLTDADRAGWLDSLGAELARHSGGAVLSCSALKRAYRDRLRAASPDLRVVWLDLDASAALARVAQRPAHFFPAGLVATQFQALESPLGEAGVLRVDALLPAGKIVEQILQWIAKGAVTR
jgi:gluconokinase